MEAINVIAVGCMRQVPKLKMKLNSQDPRIINAREAITSAHKELVKKKCQSNRTIYKQKKIEMFQMYKVIKDKELEKKVIVIEQADLGMRYLESWNLINEISGRKFTQSSQLNGNNAEDIVVLWYEHFRKLLGNSPVVTDENEEIPPVFENLYIKDDIFTLDEYKRAKRLIKCGKSAWEDGIMPEVLKYVPIDEIVLDIINKSYIYIYSEQPDLWNISNIVPVPKSGYLTKADNYRGISFTSIMAKTYNRMIINRIRPVLDPLLRHNPNGFRQKRTAVGQIIAISRILEGNKDNNLPDIFTFIDFKKAFDSIHRGKMTKVLRSYSIPDKLVHAINGYANTRAKVYSPDGVSEEFDIVAGVLQGNTLSPYLFIIVLDYVLRKAINGHNEELGFTIVPRRSRILHPTVLTDFSDDIALLSNTVSQARELLLRVESECKKVGLLLNTKKTKLMTFSTPESIVLKTADGQTLQVEKDFKYLGSWINSSEKDIKVRQALA